jgi:hypothetical protein
MYIVGSSIGWGGMDWSIWLRIATSRGLLWTQ